MRARRVAILAATFWAARWAAMEVASFAGHRLLPKGPAPSLSRRKPGLMPLRRD
jgi:hypothetical protein